MSSLTLDRWKRKAWSDNKEDRDDIAFWEQQKKEYLQVQVNPRHHQMIAEMEAGADTTEDVYDMEDAV